MEPDQQDKKGFNLKDFLLPKKEGRTSASAERASAGVLLTNEQNAKLVTMPENTPSNKVGQPMTEKERDDAPLAPLQTYKTDIESVIEHQDVSVVSIAAAEAERGGKRSGMIESIAKKDWGWAKNAAMFGGGVLLVVGALGTLAYVFLRPAPSLPQQVAATTPFIAIDDTQVLVLSKQQWSRETVMQNLTSLKDKASISLGLISRSYVALATTTEADKTKISPTVSIQSFLALIAPNAPDELLRTLDPQEYLLGVHMFDGPQPFLIVKVDSYEQAFSGMLEWERAMQQELLPLFNRNPRPKTATEQAVQATTTTTGLIVSPFRDKVAENHDARVIVNEAGDILLLWTFLDRNTLVITTADGTLRELISRRSSFVPSK
jgi:hypothetical protein